MIAGQLGRFHWVVSTDFLPLLKVALPCHLGLRLCITACDSGPIRPGPIDLAAGWATVGDVMVSPPVTPALEVPQGEYDEWYFLGAEPPSDWRPEVFVNYGGFTLTPDPTARALGHGSLPFLEERERFWRQLDQIDPVSYIASGDLDIAVSQNRDFIDRLRAGT